MTVFFRRLPKFEYLSPKSLDEAQAILTARKGAAALLAGGTDLIPRLKRHGIDTPEVIVDLKTIPGLDVLSYDEKSGLRIGPLATISAVADSPFVREHFSALALAASSMASPQVRNRGTVGGNICNAVPSADSAPALLALGASVTLKGSKGERVVPMDLFFTGPRETVLEEDELLHGISIPSPDRFARGIYLKLSPRHSMDLAIVGVAAVGRLEDGVCKDVKIALGAVAPTPVRALTAEAILKGQKVTAGLIDEAARNALTLCSPIDDHRASREYRCDMVYVMARRALRRIFLAGEA